MEYVSKSATREFYHKLDKEAVCFLALKMGYNSKQLLVNRLLGGTRLLLSDFFTMQSFYKEWSLTEKKTFASYDGIFDKVQTSFYYKQLLNYINSPCFQKLGKGKKDLIHEEQIRINKQLNNL